MANHYKDVIEFLFFDANINYAGLLLKIAAIHPKIVMDAHKELNKSGWKGDILAYREKGEKVSAIKLWRAKTGDSLKDAKEAVEEYWSTN